MPKLIADIRMGQKDYLNIAKERIDSTVIQFQEVLL